MILFFPPLPKESARHACGDLQKVPPCVLRMRLRCPSSLCCGIRLVPPEKMGMDGCRFIGVEKFCGRLFTAWHFGQPPLFVRVAKYHFPGGQWGIGKCVWNMANRFAVVPALGRKRRWYSDHCRNLILQPLAACNTPMYPPQQPLSRNANLFLQDR